jgi:hypothetical protein
VGGGDHHDGWVRDHYPVTTAGRLVALALMIGGIGLIGFVTGSLRSSRRATRRRQSVTRLRILPADHGVTVYRKRGVTPSDAHHTFMIGGVWRSGVRVLRGAHRGGADWAALRPARWREPARSPA